ncbi:MAG: 50S ribosomal protein L6 [Dehalococcoidia bacterium]|nr:50S ribosomal protein L6 [Dehalococcoidia bacterium]
MSRIGSFPILVPQGVEVKIGDNNEVMVKGGKGELRRCFPIGISIVLKEGKLLVTRTSDSKMDRSLHGLSRSLLANMVEGVSKGFKQVLEVNGIGYKAQRTGDKLEFQVGYSHPVGFSPPLNVDVTVEGTNRICISGIDREAVGDVAARIRAIRPVDHYKGKGIKLDGEKLRLKPGKAGRATGE